MKRHLVKPTKANTYRTEKSPGKASRRALINLLFENRLQAEGQARKSLAERWPLRYATDSKLSVLVPNAKAWEAGEELVNKFGRWLMDRTGFIVTHKNDRRVSATHSMWMTFNRFCGFREAGKLDSMGAARRTTKAQQKILSESTEEQRASLDRINEQLTTGRITEMMAESLTMDILGIRTGLDAETVAKNSRRYRLKPRHHATHDGIDPASDDLAGDLASIERRLEAGEITADQAADELLTV